MITLLIGICTSGSEDPTKWSDGDIVRSTRVKFLTQEQLVEVTHHNFYPFS